MTGFIEKSLLMGLGALSLTRDRIVQFVNEMVKEGEVKPEEASDIVDRLVTRGEQDREEMRKLVRDELDKLKVRLPVASHADIEELNQKIDELATKVEALAGEKKPARTRKAAE